MSDIPSEIKRTGVLVDKKFFSFLLAAILSAVALPLANIMNGAIVGNTLGALSYAAVSASFPVVQTFASVFFTLGIGGSTLVSIAKGKNNPQAANRIFTISIITMLTIGLMFTVVGLLFSSQIANAMLGGNPELAPIAEAYLRPLFIVAPLVIIMPGISNFVRAEGLLAMTSAMLIISDLLGIPATYIYISVFNWGVTGASWGFVTGYCCGSLILLLYLLSKKRTLRFDLKALVDSKNFRGNFSELGKICKTGAPAGVSGLLTAVCMVSINVIAVNTAGHNAVVAYSVCLSSTMLVSLITSGVLNAMLPVLGMAYGGGDKQAMRNIINCALLVLTVGSVLIVLLFEIFPTFFASIFGVVDPEQVAMTVTAMRIFAISCLLFPLTYFWMYYSQTIGNAGAATVVSVLSQAGLTIPAAWILADLWGIEAMWWSFTVSRVASLLVMKISSVQMIKKTAVDGKPAWKGILLYPKDTAEYPKYATCKSKDDLPKLTPLVDQPVVDSLNSLAKKGYFDEAFDVLILSRERLELRTNFSKSKIIDVNSLPESVKYTKSMNFNRFII